IIWFQLRPDLKVSLWRCICFECGRSITMLTKRIGESGHLRLCKIAANVLIFFGQ
ncbi:hypothetical protein ACH5RR_000800, partial [Cinchona calisaya]